MRSGSMAGIRLKEGREKSAGHHHPWIFSGAVAGVHGDPAPGDLVEVMDSGGGFVGRGHYSPASQIRIRLLSWNEEEAVDESWWRRRLSEALGRRRDLLARGDADACRLVHAEADLLPGLVVDRYGDFIVMQALTAGIDRIKGMLADALLEIEGPAGIYERSDVEARRLEGLNPAKGLLRGEEPPGALTIREGGLSFRVDVREGQKTGFFLDQRDNRRIVSRYAAGRSVLDCFSYTGAFAVHAAAAGASSLVMVESSGEALSAAAGNFEANGLGQTPRESVEGDAFQVLRSFRDASRAFDLIILDPPRLAPTRAHAQRAARAYKDINLLAMKLLRPGGMLATFSCSGGVDAALFREIVFWSSLDAGREVQILERLSQGSDHPVRLSFPESEYLKGFICRVL